jgi:hypothetical protein
LGYFLVVGRHRGSALLGQSKHDVVKAMPKTLKSVPRDETQFVWDWLSEFAEHYRSPLAIGFLRNSISVVAPLGDGCLKSIDVRLRPGELAAVTP